MVVELVVLHGNLKKLNVFCIIFIVLLKKVKKWNLLMLLYLLNLVPAGVISFRRYQLPEGCLPKWAESKEPLCKFHITKNKTIEDI